MITEIFQDKNVYTTDENVAFQELAVSYESKIDTEAFLKRLNQYLQKYSENPYLHYLKGQTLYDVNSYEEAMKHFDLFIDKGFYQGFFQKALCLQQLRNYTEALHFYNEALKKISSFENNANPLVKFGTWIFPSKAQILNNRAAINHNLNYNREAINDCTMAIRLEPQYSNLYFMRGCLYNSIKKSDAAIEDFKEARRLNHYNPNFSIVQGIAEENAIGFFPAVKEIATDPSNVNDTEIQLFSFENDLKDAINENTFQISTLSNDKKYDSILALAIHYALNVWKQTSPSRKNDAIFGVMCFNISSVIAKHYNYINQYELFVDLTKYANNEVKRQHFT